MMGLAVVSLLAAANQAVGDTAPTFTASIASAMADESGNLASTQFNPALGTLESVTLDLNPAIANAGSLPQTSIDSTTLSEFVHSGTVDVGLTTKTDTRALFHGVNVASPQLAHAGAGDTAYYTYTPGTLGPPATPDRVFVAVPEPTTLIAAASLLVLPIAGGARRILRKGRAA
jgi:hypothetical protein